MEAYEVAVRTLEVELGRVEQAFRDLTAEQWRTPTKLQPLDDAQPPGRCSSWPGISTSPSA